MKNIYYKISIISFLYFFLTLLQEIKTLLLLKVTVKVYKWDADYCKGLNEKL